MPGYFFDYRVIPSFSGNYSTVDAFGIGKVETRHADRNSGNAAVYSFRSNRDFAADAALRQNTLRSSAQDAYRARTDTGHVFWTEKSFLETSARDVSIRASGKARFQGNLLASTDEVGQTFFITKELSKQNADKYRVRPALTSSQLNALGTKALKQTIPTSPSASLSTFLGELIEGLPKIILSAMLSQRRKFASAGGEYLNVEFGWKPLIRDLEKIAKSVIDANKIIEQYRRDSGKNIHREYSEPPVQTFIKEYSDTETGLTNLRWLNPNPSVSLAWDSSFWQTGGVARRSITQSETRKTWFSGSWTYLLAEGSSFLEQMNRFEQEANRLLGTRLTPAVLWELAPWSWMADWFANIGTLVSVNSSLQSDNLVLRYGYLMCETRQRTAVTVAVPRYNGEVLRVNTVYTFIRKDRIRATPYGFGLNATAFTSQQWAILAALGLTKGGRSLP